MEVRRLDNSNKILNDEELDQMELISRKSIRNGGGNIKGNQEDKKRFFSKFTKQEIIDVIFKTNPEWKIDDIMFKLYEVKSGRLLDEAQRLNDRLNHTVGTSDFLVNMKKSEKKQREMDALCNDFWKIFNE